MVPVFALVFWALLCSSCNGIQAKFPAWFKFGASTAAYQIEGAWNVSDKVESIWDRFTHSDPTVIADLSNGDVACDSYSFWKRDVEMAAELGLNHYRFSISWPRLLPDGFPNHVSVDGRNYYSALIDALLEKGIEPVITLYHWDLPQKLQDLGGWTNPLISDWFADYSRVVFSLYADRVNTWITINEPIVMCDMYVTGTFAPGVEDQVLAPFLCNKHVLLAHAKAWRLYDEVYKPLYRGKVSISNHIVWMLPQTRKDNNVAKLARDYTIGRYSHAIYSKQGGWPDTVVKFMQDASIKEGYAKSRLPEFTQQELDLIRGTYDFYALNYYTCRLVRRARPGEKVDQFFIRGIPEINAVMEFEPGMVYGAVRSFATCTHGLRETLRWLREQYGDMEMLITENGYSTGGSLLRDHKRADFIRDHLEQLLISINQDKINVTGYTYWSLMDNFEWTDGYTVKFGLYEVDFTSSMRTRTPRYSANFYSEVARTRSLPVTSANSQYFVNNTWM